MADPDRAFVIPVQRRWLLWILPVLALVYFLVVIVLVVQDYELAGVDNATLAMGGAGLFLLVALIQIPFLFRRKVRAPPPTEGWTDEPPAPVAAAPRAPADDEILLTEETAQGLRVIEYSTPAKSRNRNAVYTKTHVPVSGSHVVRVETLVADAADL